MSSERYFDRVAGEWDTMRASFFSGGVREKALAVAGVEAGQVAADLGAGTGFVTEALLAAGLRVVAVDQSEEMLATIRRKYGEGRLEGRRGLAERLPLEDASVDHAFANMYLHHVASPPAAVREMVRILRPGGRLVITDLDAHEHEFLRTEHHDRWLGFERDDVGGWLRAAGLVEVAVEDAEERCTSRSESGDELADVTIFVASGTRRRPAADGD